MKFFYHTLTNQWYIDLEDCCNYFSASELRIMADMLDARNKVVKEGESEDLT